MRAAAALGVVCAVVAVAGCRATPETPPDDLGVDMAGGGDDSGMDDFAVGGDLACAVGPEVCGNGCDDDRNGYTDDDDPACTSQMLVTLAIGSSTSALWRLVLEPTPHVVVLDGNPITTNGAFATYNAAFAPAAFIAYEAGSKQLERRPIGGGAITVHDTSPYSVRDVCVFNGELLAIDPRASGSFLHRYSADGKTELGMVAVANIATACSSDGTMLYVARHATVGGSELAVYGKGASGPVDTGTAIALPDAISMGGYDRIVDLVYIKKTGLFIGLFAMSNGMADNALDGEVMAPFGLDGGVGNWIDGGIWHGVGEFVP
jgi:hypothetical protein